MFYGDITEEEKLYWVNENELFDRHMSFEIRNVLDNYTAAGHKRNEIRVGVVSPIDNKPQMNWNSLNSWVCSLLVLEEDNTTFTINSLSKSPYIKIMAFNRCEA